MASVLTASGAKLWNSIDAVLCTTLAGKFLEALQEDLGSINPYNSICSVLPSQDTGPNLRHHPNIFGFSLSKCLCPQEIQLVIGLFKTLLSRTGGWFLDLWTVSGAPHLLESKVCILCLATLSG